MCAARLLVGQHFHILLKGVFPFFFGGGGLQKLYLKLTRPDEETCTRRYHRYFTSFVYDPSRVKKISMHVFIDPQNVDCKRMPVCVFACVPARAGMCANGGGQTRSAVWRGRAALPSVPRADDFHRGDPPSKRHPPPLHPAQSSANYRCGGLSTLLR